MGAVAGGQADRLAETLSELVATCVDGENGFETAAQAIKDSAIRSLFRKYSSQRHGFRLELEHIARGIGRSASKSGSLAGTLHHAWMDIKSVATGGDEEAIIAEAERGEDSAVSAYQKALDSDLPPAVRHVIQRQFAEVKASHDRVRDLERAHTRA